MKVEMINFIINVLIDKYGVQAEELTASSIYEHLALDSLTLVEITALLEKEFKVKIPFGVFTSDVSIEESVSNVLKRVA